MSISSNRGMFIAIATFMTLFGPFATAQSYMSNYTDIGSFQNADGTAEVYMDLNQPRNNGNDPGEVDTALKVMIPNQNFYHHLVAPSERVPLHKDTSDTNASYFSVLVGIDCANRTEREGHAVFYNAEDEWIADHNYGYAAAAIAPNTLASVVMQKVCG